ncbi:hypothetical protein HNQ92_001678 [Rhabdobacter roseus]|uniref:Uncharacterized protein n=1 Tax=Rhabdobacter roseus TaxID=1655419 RepID=A0A840TPR4_9BACT|nr:hypothetical protein [Rhabdobacter roseus]
MTILVKFILSTVWLTALVLTSFLMVFFTPLTLVLVRVQR